MHVAKFRVTLEEATEWRMWPVSQTSLPWTPFSITHLNYHDCVGDTDSSKVADSANDVSKGVSITLVIAPDIAQSGAMECCSHFSL